MEVITFFVGSEETLGLVTEATLKLAPIPETNGVPVIALPTINDATDRAVEIIHKNVPIGAVEILDETLMSVINQSGVTPRKWTETPTLFFKFSGLKSGVQDNIREVKKIADKCHMKNFQFEIDPQKQAQLRSARKEALWTMLALREKEGPVWSTDVAVPLSRGAELIELSKKDLKALGLFGSILDHIGDGYFHETILFSDEKERQAVEHYVHEMVRRVLEMDGTCTGEHGIGLGKKEFLLGEVGPEPIEVMRSIKKSLNPKWLMSPGKIFDAEP